MSEQPICKLKFFQRLLWLDPNKSIIKELNYITWFFGEYVDFGFSIQDTKNFELSQYNRILVMCSSRLIKETYETFLRQQRFYPKMIVFCGSGARARQIMQTSPYKKAILNAYWQQAAIVQAITTLDATMLRDPGMMNLRVQINVQQQKKQQTQKKQEKKQEKKEINKSKDQGKKKKQAKPKQQKKQQQKKEKKKYKLKEGYVIHLAVLDQEQFKQMQKNYVNPLKKEGIQVNIQKFDDIKITLGSIDQKCILISKFSNDIQDLKASVNNFQFAIRICSNKKEQQEHQNSPDEIFLKSVKEIIEKLKNSDYID